MGSKDMTETISDGNGQNVATARTDDLPDPAQVPTAGTHDWSDETLMRYMGFLSREWPKLAQRPLHAPDAPPPNRTEVLDHMIGMIGDRAGLHLEFGVWRGNSIRRCAQRFPQTQWYGFDSFEGFPDDGRLDWQKPFKVIELPDTPKNVTLVQGYFSDTLHPFLHEMPGEIAFVNVDCDIYSSTVDIFAALEEHGRLKPGLAIYFDELVNYADYMWNEAIALFEMLERTGLSIEWVACDQKLRLPEESVQLFHDDAHPTWRDDMGSGHWMQASCVLTEGPIDCGPMSDAEWRQKLEWMVAGFRAREAFRIRAFDERQQRLEANEREKEERYKARKALEKQRQQENMERRRLEKAQQKRS